MAIQWKEDFATGFDDIDQQHRQLFASVNEMEELLDAETLDEERIQSLIDFLTTYTKGHFVVEELCMAKHNCPVSQQNHEAHQRFLEFYRHALDEYESKGPRRSWLRKLHATASAWLVNHICSVDVKLRHCHHR